MITPFLSEISISVHMRVTLVDIIWLTVGTPGLPVGAEEKEHTEHLVSVCM